MKRLLAITACGLLALALSAGGQDARDAEELVPVSSVISRKSRATVKDGYLVVAMLARQDGRINVGTRVEELTFAQLRKLLIDDGVVARSWNFDPAAGLERDVLAYMAASYLNIKPGLLTSLFGMTRRYAYREMQFRGLMVQDQSKQTISGSELLSVMTRVAAEQGKRYTGGAR